MPGPEFYAGLLVWEAVEASPSILEEEGLARDGALGSGAKQGGPIALPRCGTRPKSRGTAAFIACDSTPQQ